MLARMLSQVKKDFPNSKNISLVLLKCSRPYHWHFVLYKANLIHLDSHKKYLQLLLSHFDVLEKNIRHTMV